MNTELEQIKLAGFIDRAKQYGLNDWQIEELVKEAARGDRVYKMIFDRLQEEIGYIK